MANMYPALQCRKDGVWEVQTAKAGALLLYQDIKYPLTRGECVLVNRKLDSFLQTDAWLEEIK